MAATRYVSWTIQKATPAVTPPTAKTDLVYDGAAHPLIDAGSTTGGMLEYRYSPAESGGLSEWASDVPTAVNARGYAVQYRVTGGVNYEDVEPTNVTPLSNIAPADPEIILTPNSISLAKGQSAAITATHLGNGTIGASVTSGAEYVSVSVSGNVVTLTANETLTGTASVLVTCAATGNYKLGSARASVTVTASEAPTNYLRFSAPSDFTVSPSSAGKTWDGILYCRSGGGEWTEWDGTAPISSANGTLDLAGTGNTYITGGTSSSEARGWSINGTNVDCTGNIESLLDFGTVASGSHPAMAPYCFAWLLAQTPIVSAPSLLATTLSEGCYYALFYRCAGLASTPALPAATLAVNCYYAMFFNCGIDTLPNLPGFPVSGLGNARYYYQMFAGCSNIKVSREPSETYQYPWRIPTSGAAPTPPGIWADYMLGGTGGAFTGTPTINTTYYTDRQPVSAS